MTTLRHNSRALTGPKKLGVRKVRPAPATQPVEVTIKSKYAFVEEVAAVSREVSQRMGFDDDTTGWIELAVREAVINAIKHGNRQADDKQVEIRFVAGAGSLTVYIRDRGAGFDPTRLPDPLNPENLLNPEGRGIFFMRTFMDEVDYSTHPEGGCVVRMLKLKKESA